MWPFWFKIWFCYWLKLLPQIWTIIITSDNSFFFNFQHFLAVLITFWDLIVTQMYNLTQFFMHFPCSNYTVYCITFLLFCLNNLRTLKTYMFFIDTTFGFCPWQKQRITWQLGCSFMYILQTLSLKKTKKKQIESIFPRVLPKIFYQPR